MGIRPDDDSRDQLEGIADVGVFTLGGRPENNKYYHSLNILH